MNTAGELATTLAAARAEAEATALAAERSAQEPGADPTLTELARRLQRSVVRPLADAGVALGSPQPAAPGAGESPALLDRLWTLTLLVTELIGDPAAPPEVREAAAALQDVVCTLVTADGPEAVGARVDTLRSRLRDLPQAIVPLRNGPLLVTNATRLVDHRGEALRTLPQMALCRCGQSAMKPFCDGSHAEVGFDDAKDPKRVPDRLDTYAGDGYVVRDNRGTCAHSGFCTDNLPDVFHTAGEPFVTVSGRAGTEVLERVRACPSGALGYALAEAAASQADQDRPPSIEVSKDGPYRITGGIPLLDRRGDAVPRNQGASTEHYSLCRCGHSRNKPFCSGMHWYVGFVDPDERTGPAAAADEAEAPLVTPEPDAPVGFEEHVRQLFRARDRESMQFAFDLWSYQDVSANADEILDRVALGTMPCDGAWAADRVDLLRRWIHGGKLESALRSAATGGAPGTGAPAPTDLDAIQGRLGRTLALRRGAPVNEPTIVIEHREPLIYMLCAAAELEHALMCEYLFAAFSLKRTVEEGLTAEQVAIVERWRSTILLVAKQEMLHLAINSNLVVSLGASPHLSRPNLPQPARHYPPGVRLTLLPFGEQALRHFMFLERPEGMEMDDAEGLEAVGASVPMMGEEEIAPHLQEFQTVGHLYRSIEAGFRHLAEKLGEDELFLVPAEDQADGALFGWSALQPITSVDAVVRAIESIVEQGEGPRGNWRNAHFGRFVRVLEEYLEMVEADPGLDVVRPVLPALVRPPETGEEVPLITDPRTARVADLCNVAYEVLLQLLYRLLCHVDESAEQIRALADVSVAMMFDVIEPLADILTTLPVGPEYPGKTAGPTFELFYQPDYLLPHRRAAWLLMAEHLRDAAALADAEVAADARFQPVAAALRAHAVALRDGAR